MSILRKAIANFLWIVLITFHTIIKHVPMKMSYAIATVFSRFCYVLFNRRRNIVKEELKRLFSKRFSEKEIDMIVKNSFDIFLKRQVENILFGSFTKEQLDSLTSIEDIENLNGALQKGKGVILLLAHFGSFLLPLSVLGYKGYKVIQIGGRPLLEENNPIHKKIFEFRKNQAEKSPIQFIPTGQYLGSLVKALNNNSIVLIAFDGRVGSKWIPVKLFERTAQFSPGPFNLAIKTGATIIPTFVVREKNNRHRIVFELPMELKITNNKEKTLKVNTVEYAKIFERYLLNYPCHYAMTLYSIRNEAFRKINRPLFVD